MKIIIINGPCGVGKSTVAAGIHSVLKLSLLLSMDDQRRLFSHYREMPEESHIASLQLTADMLESALAMGRDVIIDKMLYDQEILDSYNEIASKYGAEVTEVILWAPKEMVLERASQRGYKEGGLLTPEKVELFWNKIDGMKEARSKATILDISTLSEEDVLNRVKEIAGL